jgi:cysteine desulfurase family protein (TIGR01976 family)
MDESLDETQSIVAVEDVTAIRAHFPALKREQDGAAVAFFDGPGGTQVPQAVVNAMAKYLLNHNANTHWPYPTSVETDQMIASARHAFADFLNAAPGEIVFGANMTSLTLHLARGLGHGWGPGDEIVVTDLDHHANIDTWRVLERERGIRVRSVAMKPELGELDADDLRAALTPRVKLLAIGAASNALGTINDIPLVSELAHAIGALVFVDAVHYAAHEIIDVRALGCDFLACSAYKFYGPHVGVLWGRRERLQAVDVPRLAPAPTTAPERLETGTQNHEGIVGAAAAVDFLAGLSPASGRRAALEQTLTALHARNKILLRQLWEGLSKIDGVRVFGPPPDRPRTPTLSFVVEDQKAEDVSIALAEEGVFVSCGDFYATTVVERLGYQGDGIVRAGCACYTTPDEVNRLVEGVERIAHGG